jgi:hypothetical protein
MAGALCGVLENADSGAGYISNTFSSPDFLIDKLSGANPKKTTEQIAEKHFETVKRVTKSFMDSSADGYKECSPYAAYLAWVTQFIILVRYAQYEEKAEKSLISLKKEVKAKEDKKGQVTGTMQAFQNENFLGFF